MLRSVYKLLGGLLMLLFATAAIAKVDLKVDVGWNGAYRGGRWAPVYITVADDMAQPARNVIIEIVAPHDKTFALRIFNPATIRPDPTTILVYVPLTLQLDETIATVRDMGSGKKLAEMAFERPQGPYGRVERNFYTGNTEILLGVSGVSQHGLGMLKGQFKWIDESTPTVQPGQPVVPQPDINIGYLEPRLLPDAKVGYECLDALVLAAPDLINIDEQRQSAIAAWVRGGGRLIFCPSDGVIPAEGPITKLLPCEIGAPQTINLSLADTKATGLVSRIEKLPGRKLTPSPDAQKLDLLGGKGVAYFNRAGMGQVAVISFDASKLIFTDSMSCRKFWRPIFHRTLKTRDQKPQPNYYGWGYDPSEARRVAASERIIDRLGNVPGVGRFDFSYVALVMIGMMLIVGPVDWWILRKLGRQEWTWVTTGGWIALITDRDGGVVARVPDPAAFVGHKEGEAWAMVTARSNEGFVKGDVLKGPSVYAAYSRSKETGWVVAVAAPVKRVESGIRRSLLALSSGGVLLLAIACGSAYVLGKRIAAPIVALADSLKAESAASLPPAEST